eukprot:scaffold2324_cov116-Cylindrotheca_fusiformis.AAC.3
MVRLPLRLRDPLELRLNYFYFFACIHEWTKPRRTAHLTPCAISTCLDLSQESCRASQPASRPAYKGMAIDGQKRGKRESSWQRKTGLLIVVATSGNKDLPQRGQHTMVSNPTTNQS